MIELAEVFRLFSAKYLDAHGASMLPSHRRAIDAIRQCRTEALGGHVYRCDACETKVYSYHSCKNRHCPKCHTKQTRKWLEKRQADMLPVPYFHITATLPEELREIFRANQRDGYAILMKATSESIVELARDPRYVGGTVGVLMVLHTWTQQLIHHPHVHCLVTGGGVDEEGLNWRPARKNFLVPVRALSRLIRGKVLAALEKVRPDLRLPASVRTREWVVHATRWGQGEQAVLDYLARYAFRIAITNCRIVALDEATVTFRHKDRKAKRWRTCRVTGEEFMRRFLQHVLPKGFHKVRYGGLWHPSKRKLAARIRIFLQLEQAGDPKGLKTKSTDQERGDPSTKIHQDATCTHCGKGTLILIKRIERRRAMGP